METWICLISFLVHSLLGFADAHTEVTYSTPVSGEFPEYSINGDCTSMMQVASQVNLRISDASFGTSRNNTIHCLPFQTSTYNGMPVCVEAFIFGALSATSLPLGAALGIIWAPMSNRLIAWSLALGAGALTFAVATQLFGDYLFTLMSIVQTNGHIERKESLCTHKLFDLIEIMASGLVGSFLYVKITNWLEEFTEDGKIHSVDMLRGTSARGDSIKELPSPKDSSVEHSRYVALAMWLGMLLDSIPEALMLGLMTNQHKMKFGFLFAIFIANFPEAFSGAGILKEQNWPPSLIILQWVTVCLVTGLVAMIGSFVMPESCARITLIKGLSHVTAITQGLSGGMMLAMMATAMLPESYRRGGTPSGMFFVLGFVLSVLIETMEIYFATPEQMLHRGVMFYHPFKPLPQNGVDVA